MLQPLEGVLNQAQKDSLELVDFIFHIIQPDAVEEGERIVYMDEVQLEPQQETFFLERLRDIAEGTQYVFKRDAVHLKEKCEQFVANPERFIELSRQITTDFAGRHEGNMSAGVFVVCTVRFLARANDWQKLVFLVKMDKRPSFSYSWEVRGGRKIAVVSEIQNALSETKASVQKSALINVSDLFPWDVLAFDRTSRPGLRDYFRAFLGVTERQVDSELTKQTHSAVRKWAKALSQDSLPEGEDANTYIGRSLNYLNDHDVFDTDEFVNTVVRDADEVRKAELSASLREELAQVGVAGQQFRPTPGSLPKKARRQVYQTAEGVTITYEGDNDAAGIDIRDLGNGRKQITIVTNRLEIPT